MSLTLYYAAGSCSLAALAALEEAGADYEGVRLVLAEGEQKRPAFLAINPRGRVPALVAEGQAIGENVAVLSTIAHRYPKAGLLPFDDPALLAKAYELIGWFATGVHIAFGQVFRPERYSRDETIWPALKAAGRENALAALAELDARLADGRPWLLGDRFSLVDPYAVVFWRWAPRIEADLAAYPNFDRYARRVLERPAVQRALALEAAPARTAQLA